MTRFKIGHQIGVIVHGRGLNVADARMVETLKGRVTVRRRGFTTIHEKRNISR